MTIIITKTEMLKEIKKYARNAGLVFRQCKISNLWTFHDFKTKEIVLKCTSIGQAYEDALSGYVASYNKDSKKFAHDDEQNYFIK